MKFYPTIPYRTRQFAVKMNDNNYRRRNHLQTLNYRSEDASFLAMDFKTSLRYSLESEEPMDVDFDECTVTNTEKSIPNDTVDLINQSLGNYLQTNKYNFYENYEINKLSLEDENLKYLVKREPSKKYSRSLPAILLALFGILCYWFVNYTSEINNTNILQNIADELEARVLFQDEAIQLILKNFQCVNTSEECRGILPFVGSTGVGKTLISNIIKKHFPEKYVNEVNSVKLNKMRERELEHVIGTINALMCNLIIMDDLKFEHINSVLSFVNALPNARCLFVIPILNIQKTSDNIAHTYDDYENISHKFKESGFKYEAILFNVINEDVVKSWMKELLINRNFDKKYFSVIKDVLEHQDIKHYGFKGIEAKLDLFLHQYSKR